MAGRTEESVKEEQLMAETCSRTQRSCACEISSSTANLFVSDRYKKLAILLRISEMRACKLWLCVGSLLGSFKLSAFRVQTVAQALRGEDVSKQRTHEFVLDGS
jgi:hypothetical protein